MIKNWGGKRSGAGRPASWESGETVAIRIPKKYKDDVLEYAHLLDEEEDSENYLSCDFPDQLENVQKYQQIQQVILAYSQKANRTSNPKWYHAKRLLDELWTIIRNE